jgi:hypothetical protein
MHSVQHVPMLLPTMLMCSPLTQPPRTLGFAFRLTTGAAASFVFGRGLPAAWSAAPLGRRYATSTTACWGSSFGITSTSFPLAAERCATLLSGFTCAHKHYMHASYGCSVLGLLQLL